MKRVLKTLALGLSQLPDDQLILCDQDAQAMCARAGNGVAEYRKAVRSEMWKRSWQRKWGYRR